MARLSHLSEGKNARDILVVRWGGVGDLVLTLPALYYLRQVFPQARVTIGGDRETVRLAASPQYADECVGLDGAVFSPDPIARARARRCTRRLFASFDLIVNYHPYDAVTALLEEGSVDYLSTDAEAFHKASRHALEHFFAPLDSLGLTDVCLCPRVFLSDPERHFAAEFFRWRGLGEGDGPVLALHPGSGHRRKRWPVERWVEVARRAHDGGASLLVLSGPADGDEANEIARVLDVDRVHVISGLPLRQVAALLARATLFVGNDSGLMHVATAVGTPVVAVFGPSSPWTWGPVGAANVVLHGNSGCQTCTLEELEACPFQKCFDLIRPAEVSAAVEGRLAFLASVAGQVPACQLDPHLPCLPAVEARGRDATGSLDLPSQG